MRGFVTGFVCGAVAATLYICWELGQRPEVVEAVTRRTPPPE